MSTLIDTADATDVWMGGKVRVGEASHPGPVDTQLDTLEERGSPPLTVPASPHALRRAVPMVEPLDSLLSGTRRLSLMSDGVPVVPLRQRDEVPDVASIFRSIESRPP